MVAPWRKWLDDRLPPLRSRVRVSVTLRGFHDGWKGIRVGFSLLSPVFPYYKFHSSIFPHSSYSFRFISSTPGDGASGVVGRHPCYSQTFNKWASSHLIPVVSPHPTPTLYTLLIRYVSAVGCSYVSQLPLTQCRVLCQDEVRWEV